MKIVKLGGAMTTVEMGFWGFYYLVNYICFLLNIHKIMWLTSEGEIMSIVITLLHKPVIF